jgi:predicted O-linked N-acetylglucosamine transferase (SPINDLY family)
MTPQQSLEIAVGHHRAGRRAVAEAMYRAILAEHAGYAECHYFLATVLADARRDVEAVQSYQSALAIKPDFLPAHNDLGIALDRLGDRARAIDCFQKVAQRVPRSAQAHHNLAKALKESRRLDEALAAYEAALALQPDFAEALCGLGSVLLEREEYDKAFQCLSKAVALKPNDAVAHCGLGAVLVKLKRVPEAVASCRRALELQPGLAEAHQNLGSAFSELGDFDQAIACYHRALELKPGAGNTIGSLAGAYKETAQLDKAVEGFRRCLELNFDAAIAHSNLLMTLNYCPTTTPQELLDEQKRWNQRHARPLAEFIQPHVNDREPHRRLKIGYVSADLQNHPVGRFVRSLLASHDHSSFEIFCYAQVASPDDLTRACEGYADHWRSTVGVSHEQLAAMVRQDQIDILVDLSLHTRGNRLLAFAQKPAPVQVSFAGYPGSTGLETIAYRLSDPHLDPPDQQDRSTIRLPDTFWCDQFIESELEVSVLAAQANGFVTFGSLNNFCKNNAVMLSLWARVLASVPRSRLIMLAPAGSARDWVLDHFTAAGVESGRIELMGSQPRNDYLRTYDRIDIGLDTWPYGGHSTGFDALWMGVPQVTVPGQTVVGRAGASLLTNLGLKELIAKDPEEYLRIAADLASDVPRLAELRRSMRNRMGNSPLTDGHRFARGVEDAFREIWKKWCTAEDSRD